MFAKWSDQRRRDYERRSYLIHFPSDLAAEDVQAWVRSLRGTLKGGSAFGGQQTIALDVIVTSEGIQHYMRMPWKQGKAILASLSSNVPGVSVEEAYIPGIAYSYAVELGLTNTARQLDIKDQVRLSRQLLTSIRSVLPGEVITVQWVVTPAPPRHKPVHSISRTNELKHRNLFGGDLASRDEVEDRRKKLEEPVMQAVLRVAAKAETRAKAKHLTDDVKAVMQAVRGPSTKFQKRLFTQEAIHQRVRRAAGPAINFPMELNAEELTGLIGWPLEGVMLPGLNLSSSRRLPPDNAVPTVGRVLGRSNFFGQERPVAQPYSDTDKHTWIVGASGSGKTTLLENMIAQDMATGRPIVVLEAKGDLYHATLGLVPPNRLQDVILLDVTDASKPVGFNFLDQGNRNAAIESMIGIFRHKYMSRGIWSDMVLYAGLRTVAETPGLTLVDLPTLLMPMTDADEDWARSVISAIKDAEVRATWQRIGKGGTQKREATVQPAWDRVQTLVSRPELRNVLGQSQSSFQMADVIRSNKILLINLAGLPAESASLMGTLLFDTLWREVKSRGRINHTHDLPTSLYMDEFQSFMNMPLDLGDTFAKARSFGLQLTLAHQFLAQLDGDMRQAIMSNVSTKLVMQAGADDARAVAREFGSAVEPEDFTKIGRYEAIARIATPAGVSAPLSLTTLPPPKSTAIGNQVAEYSRATYGRDANEVRDAILGRRSQPLRTNSRPPVSGSDMPF